MVGSASLQTYTVGMAMGVSGTPALVFADGELLQSYVPAAELRQYLDQRAPATN